MSGAAVRWNVQASPVDGASWRALARRADRDGYGALLAADHPGSTAAPFVALAAAAAVTDRMQLGSYVLNLGVRDVLHTAVDIATLDVVSDGRAIAGVGAGHTPAEFTMVGRARLGARERVEMCIDAASALGALLAGDTVDGAGLHEAHLGEPRPVQSPVPLLVGGNNSRLLAWAAAHADMGAVSGLGRTHPDGHQHDVRWGASDVAAHFDLVRDEAVVADREPVIDVLVQHVEITDDAWHAAERVAGQVEGLDPGSVLAAPFVLIGTAAQIAEEIERHRERLGITSYTVRAGALDAVAEIRSALGA